MRRGLTILDALRDPRLFGALPAFRDLSTWTRWLVFLSALYGLPLDQEQERIFCQHTGRSRYQPRPGGFSRAAAIVGRQAGKDRIGAIVQDFEAARAMPEPDGTEIYALSVAQDHRASLRTAFSYAVAPFEVVPSLRAMVQKRGAKDVRTTSTLSLTNGVVLAAYPCRPAAVRGVRSKVAIATELAFFRSSENLPMDAEMLRALQPTLATTGGKLIILSSPYAASGVLYDLHRRCYGVDDAETLVWVASAPEMNPTLSADYLRMMRETDPEGFEAEVNGQFRVGLSLLLDPAIIDAAVDQGVTVRPRQGGIRYRAHYDASGGRSDAAALGIGHSLPDGTVIQDALRVWPAPHDPIQVIGEASGMLRSYGLSSVTGDRYSGAFVSEAFMRHGISYRPADADRSALYLDFAARLNSGKVRLLDNPYLLRELRALERRSGQTRDRVDHPRGQHDDAAIVTAGVVASESTQGPVVGRLQLHWL